MQVLALFLTPHGPLGTLLNFPALYSYRRSGHKRGATGRTEGPAAVHAWPRARTRERQAAAATSVSLPPAGRVCLPPRSSFLPSVLFTSLQGPEAGRAF